MLGHWLTFSSLLVQLQQVQAAHHQGQDSGWHIYHRLPEWFVLNSSKILFQKCFGNTSLTYLPGPLIDLCRGPHVPDTGRIETFSSLKNSSSYFLGNQENDSLQRVYGISFPDKKRMAEHKKFLEEAAKR